MHITSKRARTYFFLAFWGFTTIAIAVILKLLPLDSFLLWVFWDGFIIYCMLFWIFQSYPSFENTNGFIGANVPNTTRAGLFYLIVSCISGLGLGILLLQAQPLYKHFFSSMCSCVVNPLIDQFTLALWGSTLGFVASGVFIYLSWAVFLLAAQNKTHKV